MQALSFNKVSKSFRRHPVIDDVEWTIQPGLATGLIGANGAGKTTLFKCLLDIHPVDKGNITIADQNHTIQAARTELVFLPEHFQAPYYLSGRRYIHLMLALYQTQPAHSIIEQLLSRLYFPLSALDKATQTYSKGMMQKLGLTACLAADKALLVLDEPMSGLDPTARHALKNILLEQKKQGKTLLFSTHLLHDIETVCDRIAILAQGKIRFHGTINEALSTYRANSLEQAYINCVAAHS